MNNASTATSCSLLTAEQEADIKARGLLNGWARATCFSINHSEAKVYVGNNAPSGGILFMGANGQIQFKPDKPRKNQKGKPIKYESCLGSEFDALLPKHPTDKDYWTKENLLKVCYWINDRPYIGITEGVWKAIAGCVNDLPTVSLLGAEMGLSGKAGDVEGKRHLVPTLRMLAEWGFGFIIIFDADAATNKNVRAAEAKLAKQLAKFNVPVRSVTGNWDAGPKGEFKGMDDFIQHKGIEEFRAILSKAKLFEDIESPDTSDSKKNKLPSADATARELAEDYRNLLAFNNEVLCWYRYEADAPGVWSPETDECIESIVYQLLQSKGFTNLPPSYVPAVVKFLRHALLERKWKERKDLLPFQNGALETATGKLLPHSPGYKFTWSLPRQHSVMALDWTNIKNWLDFATQGNQHVGDLLLAFCNAVLKGRADIQKFLHVIGIGGSGKGTLLRLIVALIGVENTHSSTLEDWCGNRFEAAQVYKKRLLIFPDEDKGTRSLGKFKQLTGGDWLRAEEKGKKPFKFQFEGMVAVASNFPIFGSDNSSGMARRTIAVPFNAVVGSTQRRDLDSTFEPELAAFTNYLLSLEDAWVERTLRGVVDIPEVNLQGWENTIRDNPVAGFLNDRLIYDPLAQTSIGDSAAAEGSLYQAYSQYCADQGHKPQAIKNFSPNLIELASTILGWHVEKVHTRVGKIIKGLRLRTQADAHIPTYDFELQSRCDGFGDGSVTDSVTGQNSYPEPIVTGVTDKPLIQVEKIIDDIKGCEEPHLGACEEVKEENILSDIELYPSHPSPEPEPLPIKEPDPSRNPSQHQSQHQSQSVTRHHKEFQEGDRVRITDNGLHHGKDGEVIHVGYGSTENDYVIALDKESHLSRQVVISVPHSQKFPILMKL